MTQPHRGPAPPTAKARPDPVMEPLLREIFGSFGAEFGYAIDEVTITVPRERIAEACELAKNDPRLQCDYLRCLAVAEYPEYFQASYMLYSIEKRHKATLKANAPKDDPWIPTVTGVWTGADWHEREGAELFGVSFQGHPDPRHLILFEEFDGKYPLRKDYPFEEVEEWTPELEDRWQEPE